MHYPGALSPATAHAKVWDDLTEREGQTLSLLVGGLSNKQIARELGISDSTVKIYVRNLLRKFRLNSRLELATRIHSAGASKLFESHAPAPEEGAIGDEGAPKVFTAELLDDLPGLIYRGGNDRAWSMIYVSAGCFRLTGYPAEYLTGSNERSFGSLILDEYADYIWYCVQYALVKGEAYQLDYRIRCADGQVKRVWETGVGVYSGKGEIVGVEGAIFERRD